MACCETCTAATPSPEISSPQEVFGTTCEQNIFKKSADKLRLPIASCFHNPSLLEGLGTYSTHDREPALQSAADVILRITSNRQNKSSTWYDSVFLIVFCSKALRTFSYTVRFGVLPNGYFGSDSFDRSKLSIMMHNKSPCCAERWRAAQYTCLSRYWAL